MPSELYYIDVRHEGLHAFRRVSGRDPYVVQQKADVQLANWNTKWQKLQNRESLLRSKEEKRDEATRLTAEAQEALKCLEDILLHTLSVNDVVDWQLLKDRTGFPKPKPKPFAAKEILPQPSLSYAQYQPLYDIWDRIFSSRRRKKELQANRAFQADLSAWHQLKARLDQENELAATAYRQSV